jgi:hypothetical protein
MVIGFTLTCLEVFLSEVSRVCGYLKMLCSNDKVIEELK